MGPEPIINIFCMSVRFGIRHLVGISAAFRRNETSRISLARPDSLLSFFRLPVLFSLHHLEKPIEEIGGVMGTGGGLRMVLD
jgi:hypothetical protein